MDKIKSKHEAVGAMVYSIRTKRYLFLLRDGHKFAGTWGLVGGKCEINETPLYTLLREIREEIGGTISDPKLIPIEVYTSEHGNFVYHTFVAPVDDEFMPELNSEHRGYCWVKLDDLPRPLHPGFWKTINVDSVRAKIKTLEKLL